MKPFITIGISVYNGQEWLSDAIESALDQSSDSGHEVIVCDDGSTDNSLEIAKKYEDEGVEVISQVNKGLASARNTIIMNMAGDYLLPLDADDMLLDNCLEELSLAIESTEADVVAPSFKEFGLGNREVVLSAEPKLDDFRTGNRLGYCAAISRRALLDIGGYSPRMVEGYEDLHLWVNLLTRGYEIVTIPKILWLYRIKDNSMYRDSIKFHKKLLAQINKDFPEAHLDF